MIWLLVLCVAAGGQSAQAVGKPGLLIVAHGSPAPAWNQPVLQQEQKVRTAFGESNPFVAIKVVFMEFAEPNVADGLEALQEAGCDRIVAVPLMVAPSSHSHWDIPALLGIYSDPGVEKLLRSEGARLVRPRVPVTLTTTLAESDVIERIMLKRVRQLSQNPEREAVVLLAHGSEAIPPAWDRFLKRTVTYVCGQTGISYGDWASVAVGQEYSRAVAAIQEAAEYRDRVIVVGAYLSLGVKRMHNQWSTRLETPEGAMHGMGNPLEGLNVQLSEQGLLPDEMVTQWIVDTARGEVQRHP
jgi:sirohydrochlorin ferrochelatase